MFQIITRPSYEPETKNFESIENSKHEIYKEWPYKAFIISFFSYEKIKILELKDPVAK